MPALVVDAPTEHAEPIVAAVLELPDGGCVRIFTSASPALAAAVLKALR